MPKNLIKAIIGRKLLSFFFDVLVIAGLVGFALFLVRHLAHFEYLFAGYQDLMYHAYKIKSIALYGIPSWDHIWSNGINHWKLYQYIPHVLTLGIAMLFHVSITKAMSFAIITLFVFLQVSVYVCLRFLRVSRLSTILAIAVSLTTFGYWGLMGNFGIMFPFLLLPFIGYMWITDVTRKKNSFLLPALAGIAWVFHPILGYTVGALWFFSFVPEFSSKNIVHFSSRLGVFFLASSPFWFNYLTKGYTFSNPILSSRDFIQMVVRGDVMGLGQLFFIVLCLSWVIVIIRTRHIVRWAKILLLYCTLYLFVIYLGMQGYLPRFVLSLQLGRAIQFIVFLLTFVFGIIFDQLFIIQSRFTKTIELCFLAFIMAEIIGMAGVYAPAPLASIVNPVAEYFKVASPPTGSVLYKDVSEASYFSPQNVRFVTSFNTHLEPHPLAQRLQQIFGNDQAYTGISAKQITLIKSYAYVLGVEYLFLPTFSPVIPELTASTSGKTAFTRVNGGPSVPTQYTILRNIDPVYNAYFVPLDAPLDLKTLPQPTLQAASNELWDEHMIRLEEEIKGQKFIPTAMKFINPDRLEIDLTKKPANVHTILVTQSYDANWHSLTIPTAKIVPTSLRFMYITLPGKTSEDLLVLKNSWPWWHWPLQGLGFFTVVLAFIFELVWKGKYGGTKI